MRLIKNLFYEQYKNFRILVRNLGSLFLLILGPLALILLVGFAYSGENLHDINLGILASDYAILEPALQNFSAFASIIHYNTTGQCLERLRLGTTHACLYFSDDFGKIDPNSTELISGVITFYYDNSRKPLSTKVVDAISAYFGVEAEKISIESARTILSDIQDFVGYVESKNQDLYALVNESNNLKTSLAERHDRLIWMRSEFDPIYTQIKYLQSELDNISNKLDQSYTELNSTNTNLHKKLSSLRKRLGYLQNLLPEEVLYLFPINNSLGFTTNLSMLEMGNTTYYNLSMYDYTLEGDIINISGLRPELNYTPNLSYPTVINISGFDSWTKTKLYLDAAITAIDLVEKELTNFSGTAEEYYNYLGYQKKQFDAAVQLIDDVRLMLDADIEATEFYSEKIDVAVAKIETTQQELNSSIRLFSRLSPGMAEKLIRPFMKNYEPILPGIKNIQAAYPGMIAIIVIFISILFANIVTLSEINSKAFYRNLLAPVNKLIFVIGLIITIMVIVFFQIFVLLLVGYFSFQVDVFSQFGTLSLVIVLLSLFFIMLGMILAILIRSEQTSVLTTTFVALAFFLFSDSVTPIEIMPKLAGFFASLNPFVIASLAFKKILIFKLGFQFISQDLFSLALYLVVGLIILLLVSARRLEN